jgi:hypothetical protein
VGADPEANLEAFQEEVAEFHAKQHRDTGQKKPRHTRSSKRMAEIDDREYAELLAAKQERDTLRARSPGWRRRPSKAADLEKKVTTLEAEKATEKDRADAAEKKVRSTRRRPTATLRDQRWELLGNAFTEKLDSMPTTKARLLSDAAAMEDQAWDARLKEVEEATGIERDAKKDGGSARAAPAAPAARAARRGRRTTRSSPRRRSPPSRAAPAAARRSAPTSRPPASAAPSSRASSARRSPDPESGYRQRGHEHTMPAQGAFPLTGVRDLPNVTIAFPGEHWSNRRASGQVVPGEAVVPVNSGGKLYMRKAVAGDAALDRATGHRAAPDRPPGPTRAARSTRSRSGRTRSPTWRSQTHEYVHAYYSGVFHLTLVTPASTRRAT